MARLAVGTSVRVGPWRSGGERGCGDGGWRRCGGGPRIEGMWATALAGLAPFTRQSGAHCKLGFQVIENKQPFQRRNVRPFCLALQLDQVELRGRATIPPTAPKHRCFMMFQPY
jgi:hypothetical protein